MPKTKTKGKAAKEAAAEDAVDAPFPKKRAMKVHSEGPEAEKEGEDKTGAADASAGKGIALRLGAGKLKHIETQYLWSQRCSMTS